MRIGVALAAALGLAAGPTTAPAPGPLHIIGGQASGCIAGAVRLPAEGPGFQTIHLSRSSFWGAPRPSRGSRRWAGRFMRRARRSLHRGHLASARRTAAGRASQPPARAGCRCRPGCAAEAGADGGGARGGGVAEPGAAGSARRRSGALDAGGVTLLHLARSARGGSHPDQSRDQAAAVRRGAGRPVVAAADAAVVRPCGAHAHPLPLPGRPARLHPGRASAAGRWARCHAAMVVRPVGRAAKPSPPSRPPPLPAACQAVMAAP